MPETKKAIDGIENLRRLVASALCPDEKTYQRFLRRMEEGALTRDENPASHFCVYFLPFNPQTREVFIVHHKKSGLWLSPGGHLDRDETPEQAVVREIREELGMEDFFRNPQCHSSFRSWISKMKGSPARLTMISGIRCLLTDPDLVWIRPNFLRQNGLPCPKPGAL